MCKGQRKWIALDQRYKALQPPSCPSLPCLHLRAKFFFLFSFPGAGAIRKACVLSAQARGGVEGWSELVRTHQVWEERDAFASGLAHAGRLRQLLVSLTCQVANLPHRTEVQGESCKQGRRAEGC